MPVAVADEYRALESLTPNPRNYNRHPGPQVARMMERMRHTAFTAPFVVNRDGLILGGHLRRLALLQLKAECYPEPQGVQPGWRVPCRVVECSETQELALLAGDNPDPAEVDFDTEGLTALLAELQDADELEGSGYSVDRLEELIGEVARVSQSAPGEDEEEPAAARKSVTIRPLLSVADVQLLEEALRLTGEENRAAAFRVVCANYVQAKAG